ncbi:MAG: trehalose-phosphatase [Anaerolineae bacterium]|nr:trehalose-phosphatase [Anaerolineae bacterium]
MDWQTPAGQSAQDLLRSLLDQPRLGLVTDVDGTISPIVADPDAAQVTPRARALLDALRSHLALVAVISGRAVADVRERIGVPGLIVAGNHGLETWADGAVRLAPEAAAYRPALEAARDALHAALPPGMQIEDKGATLSVHYRRAPDPAAAEATFGPVAQAVADAHGLRLFHGRMVFELRPPLDIDKGTAFRRLVRDYALDGAVYLGDDTTDADALRAARDLRAAGTCYALALGVESDDTPESVRAASDMLLPGVAGVEDFLAWLLSAVSASST